MVYSIAVYIIFSLFQIRNKARQMMSTPANTRTMSQQSTGARSKPDLSAQVLAWRAQLRSKKYLKDPCKEDVCHVSLTSEELDPSLLEITVLAENLRKKYFDKTFVDSQNDDLPQEPVYVTKKERTEKCLISNRTKSEICDITSNMLATIVNVDVKDSLTSEFRKMMPLCKVKKSDLLKFHDIVLDVCAQQDELFLHEDL